MLTRRQLFAVASSAPALLMTARPREAAAQRPTTQMGIAAACYMHRMEHDRSANSQNPLTDPLSFLEHCQTLGVAGIQINVSNMESDTAKRLRRKANDYGMYVEASVSLPIGDADLSRFQKTVRVAKDAGAAVLHTVLLNGRRYETFVNAEGFQGFALQAWNSLTAAEPILRKRRMKLAIENHKDLRTNELLNLIKRISSESVGVCVDTGNNIALLEDPLEVVQAFAPHAYSVHLKDTAVKEYHRGFFLSEVPLGEGFLDLPKIIQLLRQAQPGVRFNLEMTTSDPLQVPCLTKDYWSTLGLVPGSDLARTLRMVRLKQDEKPLPQLRQLSPEERVKVEEENVRKCLDYAREQLRI